MICAICRNLQLSQQINHNVSSAAVGTDEPKQITIHYFQDFGKSASGGCAYCNFIVSAILHYKLTPLTASRISLWIRASGACDLETLSTSGIQAALQIYSPIDQPPAWSSIVHSAELSSTPDSPQAFDFIRSCLRDCEANHASCKIPSPEPPTRMIDVGLPNEATVRLVESVSLPSQVTYLALSYCWGRGRTVTTTTTNIDDAKRGIPLYTLPQTIQDAIAVTRGLKQRYLWIDAICIIQDSASDWEVESSKMATVYRNAYLTLAAGTAAASDEGFLSRQHHAAEFEEPYEVKWQDGNGQPTLLRARVIPGMHTHTDDLDEEDSMPLDTRAWTLQERMLSTRILAYTKHELRWTCLSGSTCECGLLGQFTDPFKSVFSIAGEEEAHRTWHDILERYTERQISFIKDRLPALSGIAKVIQDITQSEYVAGLWSKTLIRDLAWQALDITYALQEYNAPTFSWASISGGVCLQRTNDFQKGRWFPRSTVEAFECVPQGQNPLGRAQGGWITLRGHVFKAALQGSHTSRYHVMRGESKLHISPDTILEEFDGTNQYDVVERSVRRSLLNPGAAQQRAGSGSPVYFFFVGQWIGRLDSIAKNDGYRLLVFLLLGLSPGQKGKYERLGYVVCSGYEELEAWFDPSGQEVITIV
ncbi:heterokaryon incompatibility protein-domain-containing protein [Lasiosphaeria hispida]|uniref:Heterokaryon incompatibility protein-domain-containing protein n=1 Tax=Lasiosphaeria hispida TaxID=260671 RepID=A0AAJ0HDS3_9PEZI|nr:heterokaryon incompatibility protein-domain-containing protein [Lasiosphaeria hispida]